MSALTQFPVVVLLRNQMLATVETAKGAEPFVFIGVLGGYSSPVGAKVASRHPDHHCWRRDGRWHESGKTTPLDIVAIAVGRNGEAMEFAPYGPAAGAKGGA